MSTTTQSTGKLAAIATQWSSTTDDTVRNTLLVETKKLIDSKSIDNEFDIFLSVNYTNYTNYLLHDSTPQFSYDSIIHKNRVLIYELITRFITHDTMKSYCIELFRIILLQIITNENEENSLLCHKILYELYKYYPQQLLPYINEYYNLIISLFKAFNTDIFTQLTTIDSSTVELDNNNNTIADNLLHKPLEARNSYKLISECPSSAMTLIASQQSTATDQLQHLIPHVIKCIITTAPSPYNSTCMTPVQLLPRHRLLYGEFIRAQVKIIGFVTWLIRTFNELMEPHNDTISQSIIQILSVLPPDSIDLRKELFGVMRNLIVTPYKTGLFKQIDSLQDESILFGGYISTHDSVRGLGYQILLEILYNNKTSLNQLQLFRAVAMYGKNLHDPTLGIQIQTMSARLLVALADPIYRVHDAVDLRGKYLLNRIVATIVHKLEALRELIPNTLIRIRNKQKLQQQRRKQSIVPNTHINNDNTNNYNSNTNDTSDALKRNNSSSSEHAHNTTNTTTSTSTTPSSSDHPPYQPIDLISKQYDINPDDTIRELKILFSQLMHNLRTPIWCLTNFRYTYTHSDGSQVKRPIYLDEEECNLMSRLVGAVLPCLQLYAETSGTTVLTLEQIEASKSHPIPMSSDEKDVIDGFSSIFTVLDLKTFRNIFVCHIHNLVHHIIVMHRITLVLPQHFLSLPNNNINPQQSSTAQSNNSTAAQSSQLPHSTSGVQTVGKIFADCLLHYLVRRMPQMLYNDERTNKELVQLFRLVFASVPENEHVLRPYIAQIVTNALKLAQESASPNIHLSLLRHLFRHIGGGKFEALYKEFLPLLSDLLQGLVLMQNRGSSSVREISVELALTVPARLSSLLPYIPLLMKTVLSALQATDEQVIKLGLRTLEFWVDNLNPDYLYPHLQCVLCDLMRSLCSLLRPSPSPFGTMALNVLGKLGGRNRRFLYLPYNLSYNNNTTDGLSIRMEFNRTVECNQSFTYTLDKMIDTTSKIINEKEAISIDESMNLHTRSQAYCFTRAALIGLLDLTGDVHTELNNIDVNVMSLRNNTSTLLHSDYTPGDSTAELHALRSRAQHCTTETQLNTLLTNLMISAADERLCKQSDLHVMSFLHGTLVHFTTVYITKSNVTPELATRYINPMVLLDVIVAIMSHDNIKYTHVGLYSLRIVIQTLITYCTMESACQLYVIHELLTRFTHRCYQTEWCMRNAGVVGVSTMCDLLTTEWIVQHNTELIKSLLYTIKDSQCELDIQSAELAESTLQNIVTVTLTHINALNIHKSTNDNNYDKQLDNTEHKQADPVNSSKNNMNVDESKQSTESRAADNTATTQHNNTASTTDDTTKSIVNELDRAINLPDDARKYLDLLVHYFATDLLSSTANLRKCAYRLIELIHKLTGITMLQLLHKYQKQLLSPLAQRVGSGSNPLVRLGYYSAANICIGLNNSQLLNSSQMAGLMKDILNELTSEEERQLQSTQQSSNNNILRATPLSKLQLNSMLRVESLTLMGTMLSSPQMKSTTAWKSPEHIELRENIVRMFFRSLLSRHPDVVIAARNGLQIVIEQERLPKELLQHCLRPILSNLDDYRKLSVSLLEGLSRLLELLAAFFNVTLGLKLLEHLRNFSDEKLRNELRIESSKDTNTPIQSLKLRPEDEVRIGSAIIELLHLLPQHPDQQVVDSLINQVVQLDDMLPTMPHVGNWNVGLNQQLYAAQQKNKYRDEIKMNRLHGLQLIQNEYSDLLITDTNRYINCTASPYRQPLLKFLNQIPRRAVDIFTRRLTSRRNTHLFTSMLKLHAAEPLRQAIIQYKTTLFEWTFDFDLVKIQAKYAEAEAEAQRRKLEQQQSQQNNTHNNQNTTDNTNNDVTHANNNNTQSNDTTPPTQPAAALPPQSTSTTQSTDTTTNVSATQSNPIQVPTSVPQPQPPVDPDQLLREKAERVVAGVLIVYIISAYHPEWLITSQVRQSLINNWISPISYPIKKEQDILGNQALHHFDERRNTLSCLLISFQQKLAIHNDVDYEILWILIDTINTRTLNDYTFVRNYIDQTLPELLDNTQQLQLLHHAIQYIDDMNTTDIQRNKVIEFILLPLLRWTKSRQDELIDNKYTVMNNVWTYDIMVSLCQRFQSLITRSDITTTIPKFELNIQLLKFITYSIDVFVGHNDIRSNDNLHSTAGDALWDCKSDIILTAWNLLKLDTPLLRAWSSMCIATCMSAWVINDKQNIVMQLFKGLLTRYPATSESRQITHYAIDVTFAVLSRRTASNDSSSSGGSGSHPDWVKLLYIIFTDEMNNTNMLHLYNVIAQHQSYLYPYRDMYTQFLINSATKLAGQSNARISSVITDQRKLSVELLDLVLLWEKKAMNEQLKLESSTTPNNNSNEDTEMSTEAGSNKRARHDSDNKPSSTTPRSSYTMYRFTPGMQDAILTLLIRLGIVVHDSDRQLGKRCQYLLSISLDIWHDTAHQLKLSQAVQYISSKLIQVVQSPANNDSNPLLLPQMLLYTLELCNIMIKHQSIQQITAAIPQYSIILGVALKQSHPTLILATAILIESIAKVIPPPDPVVKSNDTATSNINDNSPNQTSITPQLGNTPPSSSDNIQSDTSNLPTPDTDTNNTNLNNTSNDTPTPLTTSNGISQPVSDVSTANVMSSGESKKQLTDVDQYYMSLTEFIINGFKQIDKSNVYIHVTFLTALSTHNINYMSDHMSLILKSLQKLIKDLLLRQPSNKQSRDSMSSDERNKMHQLQEIVKKLILMCGNKLQLLNTENKKIYVTQVITLIEKTLDISLLYEMTVQLQPVLTGVFPHESTLQQKDRIAILNKMVRYDKLDRSELLGLLYSIVLEIFENITQSNKIIDWINKLQRTFLIGLRARDLYYRDRFNTVLQQHVKHTVYERLRYIFQLQDWEGLCDTFWITQCNEILLQSIDTTQSLNHTTTTPTIPPFITHKQDSNQHQQSIDSLDVDSIKISHVKRAASYLSQARKRTRQQRDSSGKLININNDLTENNEVMDDIRVFDSSSGLLLSNDTCDNKQKLISLHSSYMDICRSCTVDDLLIPLKDLMHCSNELSYHVFVKLLPSLWSKINEREHKLIQISLIHLLSKDWHVTKSIERPYVPGQSLQLTNGADDGSTCIQCIVDAVSYCIPCMELTPELLVFLAKTHNTWFTSMSILDQLINSSHSNTQLLTPGTASAYDSLCNIYKLLGEDDVWYGLSQRRWQSELSRSALSYEQFGMWDRAQDMLYIALSKRAGRDNKDSSNELIQYNVDGVSRDESMMWEREWVNCCKQLQQWEMLHDFSQSIGHAELGWESTWRLGDWPKLKDYSMKYSTEVTNIGKLYQIYSAIADRKYIEKGEVEKMVDIAGQNSLREWRSLPAFVTSAHIPLLQRFHRLVELAESSAFLLDVQNWTARAQQSVQQAIQLHSQQSVQPALPNTINTTQHQHITQALQSVPVPSIVRNVLTSWRERMLNKWDDLNAWSDVLSWRNHVFQMVHHTTSVLNSYTDAQNMSPIPRLHELPWTTIKLAHVARKQNLNGVCLSTLARLGQLSGLQLDGNDMFGRIREQVKTCLSSASEIPAALNIVNQTNLDHFSPEQRSEIFRLKGEALQHLGYGDESNTAFSACMSVSDTYGKGWLSWGAFCDRVFTLKKEGQWAEHAVVCYLQACTHSTRSHTNTANSTNSQLAGTQSKGGRARLQLPRVLWLLSHDKPINTDTDKQSNNNSAAPSSLSTTTLGPICKAFSRFADGVPLWIWLTWIPQLLTSLSRPESPVVKQILAKLSRTYPQATYYQIRAYVHDLKEQRQQDMARHIELVNQHKLALQAYQQQQAAINAKTDTNNNSDNTSAMDVDNNNSSGSTTAPPSDGTNNKSDSTVPPSQPLVPPIPPAATSAVLIAQELLASITRSSPQLFNEIERMINEFSRFNAEPEEELLTTIHALLQKCFKYPLDTSDQFINNSITSTAERIYRKFLLLEDRASDGNDRRTVFASQYKSAFYSDFVNESTRPTTVTTMIHKLKRWRGHLVWLCTHNESTLTTTQQCVHTNNNSLNSVEVRLEKVSSYLIRYNNTEIELPGQYNTCMKEPSIDSHIMIDRFENTVLITHTNGLCHRRIGICGSNGTIYYFTVHSAIQHLQRTDERMNQFYIILNYMMSKFVETRRRHLRYHIPYVLPLNSRLRLVQTDTSVHTLDDIYDESCSIRNVDIDQPILAWRQALRQIHGSEMSNIARLKIYNDICTYQVPDYLLIRYITRQIESYDQLWALRKQFTTQLALSSYICYLLKIGDRQLHRISLWRNSGQLVQHELYPTYSAHGIIESNESVPFRLTRNLTQVMGSQLVDGLLVACIMCTNSAVMKYQEVIKNYLCLFIRDDLISWNQTNRFTLQSASTTIAAQQPAHGISTQIHDTNQTTQQLIATSVVSDETQRLLELQMRDKITHNVQTVIKRIYQLLPSNDLQPQSSHSNNSSTPSHRQSIQLFASKVHLLCKTAMDKRNLAVMPITWQPYF